MAVERFRVLVDDRWLEVTLERKGDRLRVKSGDMAWDADLQRFTDTNLVSLLLNHLSVDLLVDRDGNSYTVLRDTENYRVRVQPAWSRAAARRPPKDVTEVDLTIESPFVGVVMELRVASGQQVKQGDVLLVIEAMKMQNEIKAPRGGTVKTVWARAGQKVSTKQPLLLLG